MPFFAFFLSLASLAAGAFGGDDSSSATATTDARQAELRAVAALAQQLLPAALLDSRRRGSGKLEAFVDPEALYRVHPDYPHGNEAVLSAIGAHIDEFEDACKSALDLHVLPVVVLPIADVEPSISRQT